MTGNDEPKSLRMGGEGVKNTYGQLVVCTVDSLPSTNAPPLGTGRVFYFFRSRVVFIARETTVSAVNGVSTAVSPAARPPVRARRACRTSNRRVPLPGGHARVLRFRVPVTPSTVPTAAGNSLFRSPRALLARFFGYARACVRRRRCRRPKARKIRPVVRGCFSSFQFFHVPSFFFRRARAQG